jgi:hypothetical protein
MSTNTLPTKQGQICKSNDSNEEIFIITEKDPTSFHVDSTIEVVKLNDLQRNISNPSMAPRKLIKKSTL